MGFGANYGANYDGITSGMLNMPILPVITIQQTDGTSLFTWNPFTDTRDFGLKRASISPAFDPTGGRFDLTILGKGNDLGEAQDILANTDGGFEIMFSVGKTSSVTPILLGIIEEMEVYERAYGQMEISMSGWDWFTDIVTGRIVSLYLEQRRQSNGKDPDPTDNTTLLSNIVKRLLGDDTTGGDDRQAYPGDKVNISNRISVKDQGVIINSANIVETNKKVPVFQSNLQRLVDVLAQVNAINGTISYGKPDKNFVMKYPFDTIGGVPSGILLTDDPQDPLLATWDPAKVGYIKPGTRHTRSLAGHRKRLLALDETQGQPDQKQETDTAGQNVDMKFWAQKFTPSKRKCSAIAVRVARSSALPTVALRVELREDLDNTPNGSVIAASEKLPGAISTTPDWHYFPVNQNLNTGKDYWIVVNPTGDSSKYYVWRKNAGTSRINADSTDGTIWTVRSSSYGFCFRQDFTDDVVTVLPFGITANSRHLWEEVVRKQTLSNNYTMTQFLREQYNTLSKAKATLNATIRLPDTIMLPGMQVRVRKQKSGYRIDDNYVVTHLPYIFDDAADTVTGIYNAEVTMSKFANYSY